MTLEVRELEQQTGHNTGGFSSPIFLVPKVDGTWRPDKPQSIEKVRENLSFQNGVNKDRKISYSRRGLVP